MGLEVFTFISSLVRTNPAGIDGINQGDDHILSLARSWNNPPQLKLEGTSYINSGYDYTQRAYLLEVGEPEEVLGFTLEGSKDSPIHNPAFVISNWPGGDVRLVMEGKEVPEGKSFRVGWEYDVDGSADLVVWIGMKSEEPVKFKLIHYNSIP